MNNEKEKSFIEKSAEKYLNLLKEVDKFTKPPTQAMMVLGYAIYFQRLYNLKENSSDYAKKIIKVWKNIENESYKVLDKISERNKQVFYRAKQAHEETKEKITELKNKGLSNEKIAEQMNLTEEELKNYI